MAVRWVMMGRHDREGKAKGKRALKCQGWSWLSWLSTRALKVTGPYKVNAALCGGKARFANLDMGQCWDTNSEHYDISWLLLISTGIQ